MLYNFYIFTTKFWIGNDGKSTKQTRHIEGLGGRDQCDRVVRNLLREFFDVNEFFLIQQEFGMYVIANHQDIIFQADLSHPRQISTRKDNSQWIVRIAQDER